MHGYGTEKWFSRLFLCCAAAAWPLVLLLDGHSSHYSPATIRFAAEEQVILFVLPPNTTHLSQPLDKGVFGPLKMQWRKACHSYMPRNPGKVVNQYVFSWLFHTAWLDAMTTKNITAGFRTTGIYPVDRNGIVLPGEKKKSLSEETGNHFSLPQSNRDFRILLKDNVLMMRKFPFQALLSMTLCQSWQRYSTFLAFHFAKPLWMKLKSMALEFWQTGRIWSQLKGKRERKKRRRPSKMQRSEEKLQRTPPNQQPMFDALEQSSRLLLCLTWPATHSCLHWIFF